MPRKKQKFPVTHDHTKPLIVRTHMWKEQPNREYIDKDGNRIWFTKLDDAREYAANNGYNGIKVEHK